MRVGLKKLTFWLLFCLQMKRQWESNIIVWFPFMYSQKWNCYFQYGIIMFSLSQFLHSYICMWEICVYFQDWSAHSAAGKYVTDLGNIKVPHRHMNVEIGTEAAQFPEKEYINGIFVAVCSVYITILFSIPYFCLGQVTKRTATSVSKSVDDSTSWVRYKNVTPLAFFYECFIMIFGFF